MLVTISRLVSTHESDWISIGSSFRKHLFCLALPLLAYAISQPLLAQQNDVSVLVTEDSGISASSNAQVELPVELPRSSSSKSSFNPIPVSTKPFTPPLPPASILADSDHLAKFRSSTRGTLTASTAPDSNEQLGGSAKAAMSRPAISSTSQTFASRLPNDSGLQADKAFGSSPASLDPRFGDAGSNSTSRNRFGDFGVSPAPKTESRFAPLSSSSSKASASIPVTAPPVRSSSRFSAPEVTSTKAEPPIRSVAQNRFELPTPPTSSSRFKQPAAPVIPKAPFPKAEPPKPSQLPIPQPVTTKAPQASAQSLLAPNVNSQSRRQFATLPSASSQSSSQFSAPAGGFPNPQVSKSAISGAGFGRPTATRPEQPKFLGGSRQQNPDIFGSRNSGTGGTSPSMIRRQTSSSSSSFSNSSNSSQSSIGSSRLASQSSQFGSQPKQTPLRGRPIQNDLRGGAVNNQAQTNRGVVSLNQSSDKVDRQSIDFARQQLRNIQARSADEDGTPVRLVEMFLEPLSGSQRKQMVAQYWETYYDMAALKIAIDYEKWLRSISTSTGAETGLLSAAQQMAADGQLAAEIQLGKSQSRLLDFMPNPRPDGYAPLPADEPLVERYVTDYEKYKRVRSLPTSLRGIDPMLASTLKLITRRAKTVSTAQTAAQQAGQAVRNRQIPLASAIAAGRIWRDSQLDMVASTVSYNQAISDFVLTLEPNRSPEQLTTFMLGAPKTGTQPNATNSGRQSLRQPTRSANQQPLLGFPPNRQTLQR